VTRSPKRTRPRTETALSSADPEAIVQIKIWLLGISPMVWRRVLVPNTCTLHELHGVLQVAMGWEGIHLYQFCLRAARYGSGELSGASPEVTLAALKLRKRARFAYEYDLNIPWRHEIRIENRVEPENGKAYPVCIGGNGACPPEDCGGPEAYLAGLGDMVSMAALEDLDTMAEIIGQVVLERRAELLDDEEPRWRLEHAVERSRARERAQGRPFSRRTINVRLRKGEHLDLMHQQY
jgi:Plasmid pRiA4b ORF-3-like protein